MSLETIQRKNLTRRLHFDLDDFESLGTRYEKWITNRDENAQQQLQLWSYCYIRRFLLQQFLRYGIKDGEEFECLLEKTFLRCWSKFDRIRNSKSVAGWVLSVSRNSLKNFLRDQRLPKLLELHPGDELLDEIREEIDLPLVVQSVKRAIAKLPKHLKQIANLRFIYEMPYDEISNQTGIEVKTVRAYCHKITTNLRLDPDLAALSEDFLSGS